MFSVSNIPLSTMVSLISLLFQCIKQNHKWDLTPLWNICIHVTNNWLIVYKNVSFRKRFKSQQQFDGSKQFLIISTSIETVTRLHLRFFSSTFDGNLILLTFGLFQLSSKIILTHGLQYFRAHFLIENVVATNPIENYLLRAQSPPSLSISRTKPGTIQDLCMKKFHYHHWNTFCSFQ